MPVLALTENAGVFCATAWPLAVGWIENPREVPSDRLLSEARPAASPPLSAFAAPVVPVSYTHLTLPTKRIV